MNYETVIGLEVHLHLNTRTKAFCGCSTQFGNPANTQACPVCLGFPGTLPVYNKTALDFGIKVGLALGCTIQNYTKFDRKNYFYPDLPKAYQISQFDLPLAREGFIDIELDNNGHKRIGIIRVHMEEDAGKLIHETSESLVDYNRTGVPLLEIVTHPDMNSPEEAYKYLTNLKAVLSYLDVSDCDMEKGSLRCDANVSIRKPGVKELGTKAELKNMNSFKAVKDALEYEVKRQAAVLDEGGKIIQETRLWDEKSGQSVSMRTKEGAQDYRYFPEPDLPPFVIDKARIEQIKAAIPELPKEKKNRLMKDFGLSETDALILVASKKDAEFSEGCINNYSAVDKKAVVNWLIGPLLSEANVRNCAISELKIAPQGLAGLIGLVNSDKISNLTAKIVLKDMIDSGKSAEAIISEKNLGQVSDESSLNAHIEEVIKANTPTVESYKAGKTNAVMFLVGQVMKRSGGKANPKMVQDMLKRRLDNA
ncbi:MAG: Asp-tRNA(Asn)/Glu-tRNA(Gln) amidotransferase subunit GatB [Candidatus Omnitrophica bacterium]|nr:Asp-tRNA(Asn)/Glu-tRNA(Gln) amidotransferase subunit GatB [Candidatus Omnitrophota bacterium]